MTRLTIFAKGNLDVRDTLHALKVGGQLKWNGVNELLRTRSSPIVARVRHEVCVRSDALLEATTAVPPALAARHLPLGVYTPPIQFSQALFEIDADVIVLSIQPDIAINILRHRGDGFLFYPNDWRRWRPEDQAWLRESFVEEGLLDAATSMANFARIIERIRQHSDVPILIYNVSSVTPGQSIHTYADLDEALSTRIRRFNLGLIELSRQTGVSIIDVDAVVARAGADRLKYDATHLTGEGCRAVAEEVVRVLADLGCLPMEADG
ncbi:MAG: SGNH/GDSL hydrolase family protein [Caulobacterales bacterium]